MRKRSSKQKRSAPRRAFRHYKISQVLESKRNIQYTSIILCNESKSIYKKDKRENKLKSCKKNRTSWWKLSKINKRLVRYLI